VSSDQEQTQIQIDLPLDDIKVFCQRWHITEFALFGSVLRDDFGPDSDIDVLVTFAPDSPRTLDDVFTMDREIEMIFGREVDLVDRKAVEQSPNYIRRKAILKSARVIYVA
jgi:predicted nucleotidyltransferase